MDHVNTARPMTLSEMVAEASQVAQRARDAAGGAGQATAARGESATAAAGESAAEFTFDDLLDVVNPLQHLPVVSTAYRELTGDEISGHAKVIGGTIYGGPLGMIASGLDAALRQESGKDSGEHVVAALFGEDGAETAPDDAGTALAEAGSEVDTEGPATAGAGTAAGQTAEDTATAALPPSLHAALTPGGGPLFLDHPGLVAGPAQPAASAAATSAATTSAATTSAAKGAAQPPLPEGVKTGRDALAAFARDLRGVTGQAAGDRSAAAARGAGTGTEDAAASGNARLQAQEARADTGAAAGARGNAGPDSQYDFMPLRRQDTNHQTSHSDQMRRLQRLEAESDARAEPRVNPTTARLQTGPDDRGEAIGSTAREDRDARADTRSGAADNVPPDFAERMKHALDKYRKMNAGE